MIIHGNYEDNPVKADIIITDMPYGTTNCAWDTPVDLKQFWEIAELTSAGHVIAFAQSPFDKVLGCSNLARLKYEIIWEKTHATGHLNAKKMPMKAHENILIFYPKMRVYNPIKTQGHVRKTATKRGDKTQVYGAQRIEDLHYDSTERYPRSVIKLPSDKQKMSLHPTQKPVALMEWLIRTYTNPGDIVLDPFMGSGTTGVACKNLERDFIGIEKELEYFEIARSRLI